MPNDDELEKYLSEFSPRAVRPLDVPRPVVWPWLKPMTAAAVVLACAGSAVWYGRSVRVEQTPSPPSVTDRDARPDAGRPNWFALTRLALKDEGEFEIELERESRAELPGFTGSESGLHILARE